jgi:hypothetical protein
MFAFFARLFASKGFIEDALLQSVVSQDPASSLWTCRTVLLGSSRKFTAMLAIDNSLSRRLKIEVPAEYEFVDGRYRIPGQLCNDSPLSFQLQASALEAGYGLVSIYYEAAGLIGGSMILSSEPIGLSEPEKISEINEYRARRFAKWSEFNGV